MKRPELALEPELEALLNPRKIERIAPPEVRARALARGRAIIAAGGRIPPRASLGLLMRPTAKPASVFGSIRFILPASVAAAAVAVATVAALRTSPAHGPVSPATPPASRAIAAPLDDAPTELPPTPAPLVVAPKPALGAARPEREVGSTEFELLSRAQAAYTHRDFSRAFALIGELSRRFPNGHLAEEREALRVRSLFAVGRADEGRRAAAGFATRFPRSVLLPKEGKL